MTPREPTQNADELPKVLGFTTALCVVVGSVIGSGIFIVPATVASNIPAIGPIVLAWVAGGLFCLAGVLTLSELTAMLPRAGGPYVYLREAYGPMPAFLFGWTEFWVIRSGSMAALAAAFAQYAAQLVPNPTGTSPQAWQTILACGAMLGVACINIVGTRRGGEVQVIGTLLKVGALAAMIVVPFALGKVDIAHWSPVWPARVDAGFFAAFMAAMVPVLWSYDGWIHASNMAEEVHDPARNMPRTLICGGVILIGIYVSMTLVYHLVLPMEQMQAIGNAAKTEARPTPVAAVFCRQLIGARGGVAIALVVMTSTFIALNGNALSGPRAYFALARDGLFPQALARVHPRFQTPARSIAAQTGWAMLLTILGSALTLLPQPRGLPRWLAPAWNTLHKQPLYDIMFTYVIFGGTLIYTLSIATVFTLRRSQPDLPRPYKTLGYPVTPVIYVAAALLLLGSMLREKPFESMAGLGIILTGLPVYALRRHYIAAMVNHRG